MGKHEGKPFLKKFLLELLITVIAAVGIFILINISVQYAVVDGPSMQPNLEDGQRLILNKIAYSNPQRGDIIVFPPPHIDNPEKNYIKRIIGLPGETVEIIDGTVYINGQALEEPYIENSGGVNSDPYTVPEGEYFVLGDNRINSSDSRNGWTVPEETIVGKAWLSVWPLAEIGLAPNHNFKEEEVGLLPIGFVFAGLSAVALNRRRVKP